MIARLRGELVELTEDSVVVDCGGVGYRAFVSAATRAALPREGTALSLGIYTHVTDGAVTLFGFVGPVEREMFERLIAVQGIGPRTALEILSGIDPVELAQTLVAEDTARLVKLKGIGKKTAERLVVELRDKVGAIGALAGRLHAPAGRTSERAGAGVAPGASSARSAFRGPWAEVHGALVSLGYRPAEADRMVAALVPAADGESSPVPSVEELLRAALRTGAHQAVR
jgi:Holliday junction DNA helicase RuvA